MSADYSVEQLEQMIDRLTAEIEQADDRGVTVMPEKRERLAGLQKLLQVKRQHARNDYQP